MKKKNMLIACLMVGKDLLFSSFFSGRENTLVIRAHQKGREALVQWKLSGRAPWPGLGR